jgi:hypothetical protein
VAVRAENAWPSVFRTRRGCKEGLVTDLTGQVVDIVGHFPGGRNYQFSTTFTSLLKSSRGYEHVGIGAKQEWHHQAPAIMKRGEEVNFIDI